MLEDGECRDSLAIHTARQFKLPGHVLLRAEDIANKFKHRSQISPTSPAYPTHTTSWTTETAITPTNLPAAAVVKYVDESPVVHVLETAAVLASTDDGDGVEDGQLPNQTVTNSDNFLGTDEGITRSQSDGLPMSMSRVAKYNIQKVKRHMEKVLGIGAMIVRNGEDPPPSAEGHSCVYVLRLRGHVSRLCIGQDSYRVGVWSRSCPLRKQSHSLIVTLCNG